ncbi:MAG: hypothetical protein COX62_01190 [Deltaproteobacteria bacterium CG_4_10_14_0_2_um_filter_43_8]|nr:MAG: hypothetical protein COV43_00615 [Deltaproteobacteria bacterium CG11_big_fil_rev_8_21_14_0_20_42_23]PJA21890.1 MAG: hypothetical protein COX62_01190 [Deltaproteobacteria bacterium CG_4_10_14_0_2_um_filter_43_8]PJC64522.1 MAG: hypothetical protein CO021_03600 [Deltaproteobacteria bacterium CG_4_9_14_0_2_um_filter_42_21]
MMKNSTRLLVVGGNGFIGHHIVNHALQLGWEVTSLDISSSISHGEASSPVQHVVANITDSHSLKAALQNKSFEYVINCGGYIDHALFFHGGRNVFTVHFEGVLNLVENLNRDALKAFINIGSSDECGNAPAPQVETQREAPISPYSLGKTAAAHFLQMLYRTESFPGTTLRLFLTYGPGQDLHRFLPQIINACLKNQSFPTSRGEQLRDFCFVQDVVDAVFATFNCQSARGEVMNISSGKPVSIRQVIETVQQLIGKGEPRFGEIAYRPGENMELYADISKARTLLKWKPKISLDQGLEKTIKWVKGNL